MTHALFIAKAPTIVSWLVRDLRLTVNQACGILGNIGRECGGFELLQEQKPESGVGGYGWDQWTGPRRAAFFAFAKDHGLAPSSDEANYRFLIDELETSEAGALRAIRLTRTLEEATASFEQRYERAGVPAIADRVTWAKIALTAYEASSKPPVRGDR